MKRLVVDTSALLRLYVPDGPVPAGLGDDLDAAARAEVELLAPELMLAELGQVLWKKEQARLLSAQECDAIRAAVLDLPLGVVGHRELLPDAVALARQLGLTVYDALFLALAFSRRAALVTADARLAAAFAAAAGR